MVIKKDWLVIKIGGISFTSIVIFYLTYSNIKADLFHLYYFATLIFQVYLTWEVFLLFLKHLDKKIKWDGSLKKRLFIQTVGGTFIILLAFTFIQYLIYPIDKLVLNKHRLHGYWDFDIFICILLAIIIQLVYIIYYFIIHWKRIAPSEGRNIIKKELISRIGNRKIVLSESEIFCFYTEDKTVYALTENRNKHILDTSLEVLINQVCPSDFFRVNRQCIIRKSCIKELKSEPNNRLSIITILNSDVTKPIIVSRKNTPKFRKWFNS